MKKIILINLFIFFLQGCLYTQWVRTNGPIFNHSVFPSFALGCSNSVILDCQSVNGVFLSTDNGENWISCLQTGEVAYSIAANNAEIYAGFISCFYTYYTLRRSTNNGQSWSATNLNRQYINAVALSGVYIYAGTDSGVFRSSNSGVFWSHTSLAYQKVSSLAASGATIFAGLEGNSSRGVYKSTDNGQNWNISLNNPGSNVTSLALNGMNVFAGTMGNGVYISTNFGLNWTSVSIDNKSILCLITSGSNIIAGAMGGVYLSTNNGQTWDPKNEGFYYPGAQSLVIANGYVFAGKDTVWRRPLSELVTQLKLVSEEMPLSFDLSQNYPNPFNPETNIKYSIAKQSFVSLKIYDVLGREVITLVNEKLATGTYNITFNATEYASGVYFYKLKAGDFTDVKKMVFIK